MSVGMIVCRSTDSGAPTLSGTAATLANVLDWALAKKGWTTIASDGATGDRIYQTAAGNGYCLYVAHNATISGAANYATLRGCESTSTLSSLVNPFPSTAQLGNTVQRVATSSGVGGAAQPYVIYLTDRFIRMVMQNGITTQWTGFQFGDLYGAQSGDVYATIMSAPCYTAAYAMDVNGWQGQASSYGGAYAFARDITGTVISTGALNSGLVGNTLGANIRATAARAGYMNRLVRIKVSVDCSGSAAWPSAGALTVAPTAVQARGWIPNWWCPVHNGWGALSNGDTFSDSAYNPAASFRMYGGSTGGGWSFHEETDTWSVPVG